MATVQESLPHLSSLSLEEATPPMAAPLPPRQTNSSTATENSHSKIPDSVDSALLAALRDPRERLGLLKLENVMVNFFHSNDPYIDIGGPYNSVVVSPSTGSNAPTPQRPQTTFQRCILHRLADRFRMTRETNNPYIRLWKQADSCLPPSLLVDLDPSEYMLDQQHSQAPMTAASNTMLPPNPFQNQNPPKNMKMKIMKRSGSSGVSNSSDSSRNNRKKNSSATNLSEKEKAYAEARARIFSDGDGNDQQSTPSDAPNPPAAAAVVTSLHKAASSSSLPSSEEDNGTSSNNNNIAATTKSGSTRPSKATWRNRRQEENDPDFQRGVVLQPPAYDYYSHAAPSWGGQDAYYANNAYAATPGRGAGRGGRGGGGRYQQHNYYGGNNNGYVYRRSHSGEASPAAANVHSLEEFPSLR